MEYWTSIPLAMLFSGVAIFTKTYPAQNDWLRWLRLGLAIPACAFWVVAANAPHPHKLVPPPANHVQMFVYSTYMIMKTLDVCLIGFWDEARDIPRWVKKERKGEDVVAFRTLPLPTTFKDRLAYAMDTLLSLRGASLFRDHSWDWARKSVREYEAPIGRLNVLKLKVRNLLFDLACYDITEHILCTPKWNYMIPNPVTTLSASRQIYLTLAMGAMTYGGNDMPFFACDVFFGAVLGFPISPSIYDAGNPFMSHSLSDFWSIKWHAQFQRVFDRLSRPVIWAATRKDGRLRVSRSTLNLLRCCAIFSISTLLHLGIGYAIPAVPWILRPFWDIGVLKFFLIQPLGLLIEVTVIRPLTETLPGRWKSVARRCFFWCWIVWTGRWYTDAYVLQGLFQKRELGVIAEPLERLWRTHGLKKALPVGRVSGL